MYRLGGHKGAVRAVGYLPDGRLVSAGQDGRVLSHTQGSEPELLYKSWRPVYAVAVRPDGGRLALGGRLITDDPGNPVRLFDLIRREPLVTLDCTVTEQGFLSGGRVRLPRIVTRPVARSVWSLSWSADGRYLAAAVRRPGGANIPEGGGGRWWDAETGVTHPLPADTFAVRFGQVGTRLAVCRRNVVEWFNHPSDDTAVWRLPHSVGFAAEVADDPAGGWVAVAAGGFILHGPAGGKPRRTKTGLRAVTTLAVTPDGRSVLAGGSLGWVEQYDVASGEQRAGYDFALGAVHAVAVAPDGLTAAAGGEKGLAVFDLDAG